MCFVDKLRLLETCLLNVGSFVDRYRVGLELVFPNSLCKCHGAPKGCMDFGSLLNVSFMQLELGHTNLL